MTEYFRIHPKQRRGGRESFQIKEGGIQWEMTLRPDLYRIGMCQLEMFSAERILY